MQRFGFELAETGPGLRLRLAITEAGIAERKIRDLRRLYGLAALDRSGTPYAQLQAWRRQYIKSCDLASISLGQLWDGYAWPTDGALERSYVWRPAKA